MMEPFLHSVAKDLLQRFDSQSQGLSELTLLLPSRRAALFFNRHLASLIDKPVWRPRVRSITDAMYELANMRPAQPLSLCYRLYGHYIDAMKTAGTKVDEPFDNFYFWGNVMLSDFDQIDKYLIDAQKLYSNIFDIKEIDNRFDEFTEERLAKIVEFLNMTDDGQQRDGIRSRYSKIWQCLGGIYERFTHELVEVGVGYEGLVYRQAVQHLNGANSPLLGAGQWAVVGFNAITPCERKLFEHLSAHNSALFYWDYDQYYTERIERHEAAMFMSSNLKQFPNALSRSYFDNLSQPKHSLMVLSAPSGVAQAKVLPRILGELADAGQPLGIDTAVVLLDETLLMPVLSALPGQVVNPNVSLEYPMRGTPAYSLVDTLLGMHQNASNGALYHRDALSLLNHPYVRTISPSSDELKRKIIKNKLMRIEAHQFDAFPELALLVDMSERSAVELCRHIAACIAHVADGLQQQMAASTKTAEVPMVHIEHELLSAMYKAMNRLTDLLAEMGTDGEMLKVKTLRTLFRQVSMEERVSFEGEPLSGLQVMGLLETRTLDFDNVVLLSANDSTLPSTSTAPSFILPVLRHALGMPDYNHQNALSAYYFYRLLQRAQRVYMVYDGSSDAGEESRYIKQIEMESGLPMTRRAAQFSVGLMPDQSMEVHKTPEIMQVLYDGYIVGHQVDRAKYMSATALSRYKNCGIRFYLNHIVGLREPDEMEEALDERGVGTILHSAIEKLYGPALNTEVTDEWIKAHATPKRQKEVVEQAFSEEYKLPMDNLIGRNKLIVERIEYMLEQMLKIDAQHRTPYTLVASEGEIRGQFEIEVDGKPMQVALGGKIDRQDRQNDRYRIVDFKTGKYEASKCAFENIDDLRKMKRDGVFQLMFYSELVARQKNIDPQKIWPQLWFVRHNNDAPTVKQGGRNKKSDTSYGPHREAFCGLMKQLLQELFDPTVPFRSTDDPQNQCKLCAYADICRPQTS